MASRSDDIGDRLFRDQITFATAPAVPASSFGNREIDAADPIDATKLEHRFIRTLAQAHGSAAVAERRVVHRAYAAGTVVAVRSGVVVACVGDSTITVDVKKNGTSILSATTTLTSANAAFANVVGAILTAAYVAGDVFEVIVTVSAGTGTLGQGLAVDLVVSEAAG